MMVRVSGPLRVVTDRPLLVSQVRVRAARDRAEQGGLTTSFDDSVPVVDGQLDMVVLPGPAVMMLEVTGGFSHAVALVVPDVPEATLEQCVTAAQVAGEADRRTLERLAGEVARDALAVSEAVGRAEDSATAAGAAEARAGEHADAAAGSARDAAGSAERAATIAGSTRWVGTQLEVNGQLSPDLKGEQGERGLQGDQGPRGERGPAGADGTVSFEDLTPEQRESLKGDGASSWEDIAGKPTTFTPAVHSHEIGDVRGLVARFGGGDWVETPTATGDYSVALGNAASAEGQWSAALGNYASAVGRAGFALGPSAEAGGDFSLALGNAASSAGDRSTAIGNLASATGGFSQALTALAKATKEQHTVIGVNATDETIPTDIAGTVVIGKADVPVYLAGRDILAELDTAVASATPSWDSLSGKPTVFTPAVHSHTAAEISDASATGRAVLTAPFASVARSTLGAASASHRHTLADVSDVPNKHSSAPDGWSLMSRDSTGRSQVADPVDVSDIANKRYVDTTLANAKAYTDALIVEGDVTAMDGKLHIVYE